MKNEQETYKLIQKYYIGEKSNILEIGANNCSLINYFIVKGYTKPTALEKGFMIAEQCFLTYKIHKADIKYIEEENSLVFEDIDLRKTPLDKSAEITKIINSEYQEELDRYKAKYYSNFINNKDFLDSFFDNRYNVILCSFVIHYKPPDKDIEIINKFKNIAAINGVIYIKIHNLEKLNNIEEGNKRVGNTIVGKNGVIQYPFDLNRIEKYKKAFSCYKEIITDDITELVLGNTQ